MKTHLKKKLVLSVAALSVLAIAGLAEKDLILKTWTARSVAASAGSQVGLKVAIIEFAQIPSPEVIAHLKQFPGVVSLQRFDSWDSDYFSRLYKIQWKENLDISAELSDADWTKNLRAFAQDFATISNVEFSQEVVSSNFALEPGDQARDLTTDPYASYQWALRSSGQKVVRDYTDIQSDVITAGNQVADIGLDPKTDVDKLMKNDVMVAVMDSGVDLAHPDLINNLYHNTSECLSDGSIPLNPTTDNDGNGYMGDCIGWNFVVDSGDGNNRPDDDLGHGTHVAGIIAAEKNNKIGVSGISNRIKILPIRVTWAQESPGSKKSLALTDRIAKGILYAAKMKAKVVNISMGWPNSSDSAFLRNAFATAISSGVTVVAAAGNNTTNVPVFPCAYPGVICVAATSLDGRLAPFSNYGSHVDLSAPGEEILSTYPISIPSMGAPPATYFTDPRYEILSGTSMSAPYVSGAVAVLKGIYPAISENEIKARLFASSQNLVPSNLTGDFAKSYIQFGTLKINQAITMAPRAVVAPDFKGLDRVTFASPGNNFVLNIPINSYWTAATNVVVTATVDSPQWTLLSAHSSKIDFTSSINSGVLKLTGHLTDLNQSSQLRLKIEVDVPGQPARIFAHDFEASRILVTDPQVIKIPVLVKNIPRALSLLSMNKVNPADASEFYWMDSAQYHLMRNTGASYSQMDFPAVASNQSLLSLLKIPTYGSAGANYWLGTIVSDTSGSKYISYRYYDKNLQPSAGLSEVEFVPETAVIDQAAMTSLSFLPWQAGGKSALAVPIFQTSGGVPSADQDKNWTHFTDNTTKRPGIFFLVPQKTATGWTFQTRLFDNFQFVNNFKAKLNLSNLISVEALHMMPQGSDKTKISILMSYGQSSLRQYVIITATLAQMMNHDFTNLGHVVSASHSSTELDHASMSQVQMLNPKASQPLAFTAPISQRVADLILVDANARQVLSQESLSPGFRYDAILGLISSFFDGKKYYSFLEATSHLILHVTAPGGPAAQFETNIHRSSLLPGQVFSESYRPVRYTTAQGQVKAALYADATQISSNHVYVNVADDQKGIVSPLGLNVDVPPNCVTMAPQSMINVASDDIVILCRTSATDFELEVLPIGE